MRTAASSCRRRSGRTRCSRRRRPYPRAGARGARVRRCDRTRQRGTARPNPGTAHRCESRRPPRAAPCRSTSARRRRTGPSGDRAARGGRHRIGTAMCRSALGRGAVSWSPPRCRRYSCDALGPLRTARDRTALDRAVACPRCCPHGSRRSSTSSPRSPTRFRDRGHRLYLVGGSVRDLLLVQHDRQDFDLDLTTDARPKEIKACLDGWADALWTQGEQFGTIGAHKHDTVTGAARIYEITTFRAEVVRATTRASRTWCSPTTSRRPRPARLHGQRDGARAHRESGDAGARRSVRRRRRPRRRASLRTPVAPEVSFGDDPLRMLRAARFIAGYELEPTEELIGGGAGDGGPAGDRVAGADPRRVRQADHRRPPVGRAVVPRRHRPRRSVPARAAGDAPRARSDPPPQGRPHATRSPWSRTSARPPERGRRSTSACTRLAALFHDIGKPQHPRLPRRARARRSTITTRSAPG